MFVFLTFSVFTQENQTTPSFIEDHIFSLDLSYILKNFKNSGWGFGISYEQIFFACWSIKGGFSHLTFWTNNAEVRTVTAENVSLGTFFYPFCRKFNYLYFGGGCCTDFVQYGSSKNNTLIYLFPQIGWKQNIKDIVFFDVFYKYNFPITNGPVSAYEEIISEQRNGFGISIKFNFSKIISLLKR